MGQGHYVLMNQDGMYYKETLRNGYRVYTDREDMAHVFTAYVSVFNARFPGERVIGE
jgi:hypothetical protein